MGDTLRALARLADEGKHTVHVTRTFPLAQAAEAQAFVRNGDTMGKVVLVVGQ